MCEQLMDLLPIGWWWSNRVMFQESQSSASNYSGVCVLMVSMQSPSSTSVGVLAFAEELWDMHQIAVSIPSGGTTSPVPLVVVINCLSMLFGTQGRPRRLKSFFFFLPNKKWGPWRDIFAWEGPTGSCLVSVLPFVCYSLILRGTGTGQEREWSFRWINYKLSRGIWF